jgi:Co/Zn/Cd efflux system component
MEECCSFAEIPARQRRVLHVVLWINVAMFLAEFVAGLLGQSTALLADSVDMLGDAIVYGFSLYVVGRPAVWQVRAALLKGVLMAAFGVGLLVQVIYKVIGGIVPAADVMGGVGLLALVANVCCLLLLWRRRADDINMRSAWLCSRNDVVANGGVLIAAAAVALTGSMWPDIVVGLAIAAIFLTSAGGVIRRARQVVLIAQ